MKAHFLRCFLAGLVAVLPIGGLILLVVQLDQSLRPLVRGTVLDLPGLAIVVTIVALYLIGLAVSSVLGKLLWNLIDRILCSLPGLSLLYNTLKQLLGYGGGKDALYLRVVFVTSAPGAQELGLVTEEPDAALGRTRLTVFVPGSPNPMIGRLLYVDPAQVVPSTIPVDVAIKAVFSNGKTGLS